MKKIIYNIAIVLAASCLFASCEDDNYDEPNSGIKGRFIDAETSEVVPMPVQGTSSIQIRMYERDRYYSTGDDYSQLPVITYPKIDGTYENSWMFSKQYILTLEQTNFYPVDTMVVDLNAGGLTDQDIKVIPYARIKVNNAVFENKKLKVSYTITRSKDDYKIENAFLAWHISPYIDKMSGNSEELVTVDYTNVSDKDILKNNARITNSELAVLLDKSEEQVAADIAKLEADGVIKGYSAIVDESAYDPNSVFALIELKVTPQSQSGFDEIANQIASYEQVESVRLMSGAYDIIVAVNGANIRDISQFVSQRLATIDAVQSTATHFVLKVYKDNGIMISTDDKDERGLISP